MSFNNSNNMSLFDQFNTKHNILLDPMNNHQVDYLQLTKNDHRSDCLVQVSRHRIINIHHQIVIAAQIIILHRSNRIPSVELFSTIKSLPQIVMLIIQIVNVHFFFHQNPIYEVSPCLLLLPLSHHHHQLPINNKCQSVQQHLNVSCHSSFVD